MVRYYYIVEIEVPPGGLGRRVDDMHRFHHQCGIKDQRGPRRRDDEHDFIRWCFADLATAEAFAAHRIRTLDAIWRRDIATKKPSPLLRAAILLGISLGCAVAWPHSGNSTGKCFMPVGSATEMLAIGAAVVGLGGLISVERIFGVGLKLEGPFFDSTHLS